MTISSWNRERLRELGLDAELIPPGIDLENFRPLQAVERRSGMMLALGRSNPLKNLPLTIDAWRSLIGRGQGGERPELCMFGIEPELAAESGMRYVVSPSDEQVNELFNEATVFVQTSIHEGFACRRWRRWPPAARSCAPTPTATATSAWTGRTA